jgi:hypothetical protein
MRTERRTKMEKYYLMMIFVVLSLIGTIGCSSISPTWYHPSKSAQDFEQDKYDCKGIAEQRAYNRGGQRYASNPLIVNSEWRDCMRIKYGWKSE